MRVNIFVLFLILVGSYSFHFYCDVMGLFFVFCFFVDAIYQVKKVPFYPLFSGSCCHEWLNIFPLFFHQWSYMGLLVLFFLFYFIISRSSFLIKHHNFYINTSLFRFPIFSWVIFSYLSRNLSQLICQTFWLIIIHNIALLVFWCL